MDLLTAARNGFKIARYGWRVIFSPAG